MSFYGAQNVLSVWGGDLINSLGSISYSVWILYILLLLTNVPHFFQCLQGGDVSEKMGDIVRYKSFIYAPLFSFKQVQLLQFHYYKNIRVKQDDK